MRLETRSVPFEIKSVDGNGSSFRGTAAVFNNIDHGRDLIHPNAYDAHIDEFRAQGKIRNEHLDTIGKVTDAQLTTKGLEIEGKISDTQAGRDVKILLADGVINRLSIGQYVLGRQWLESPDDVHAHWKSVGYNPTSDDLERLGTEEGGGGGIRLISKAKPIEASTVFNPMNDRAEITSVKANGLLVGRTLDAHSADVLVRAGEWLERLKALYGKRSADGRSLNRKHIETLERLYADLGAFREVLAEAECKGAVPYSAAPVTDDAWDAAAAKKRLKEWAGDDMAKYRNGFAWFDSSKPDDLGSYKLPHHDVHDGKFVTNKRGVEAAMAALDGARGGASIPEADRGKVRAHLAKHYAQWGGTPPEPGKSNACPETGEVMTGYSDDPMDTCGDGTRPETAVPGNEVTMTDAADEAARINRSLEALMADVNTYCDVAHLS